MVSTLMPSRGQKEDTMSRLLTTIVAILLAGICSAVAWAGPLTVDPLVLISAPSPFVGCAADDVAGQPGVVFPNSVVEPWVEVNPTNPLNIVAGFQQERWSNGGARGLVAAVSTDGGATWSQVAIPKIVVCSGGTTANGGDFKRATDPWLTFAPNGDLYFLSLSLDIETPPKGSGGFGKNALFVSQSTDGGLNWSDPIKIAEDTNPRFLNDKNSITADPDDANFVFAVWDRLQLPVGTVINPENVIGLGFKGPAMFSRTTDGGQTWEPARIFYNPGGNNQTIGNQIVVLPDEAGTLVNVFNEILNFKNPGGQTFVFNVSLVRSSDKGATWTHGQAIRAAQLLTKAAFDPDQSGVRDPDTGALVRTGDIIPEIAVDRNPTSPGFGNLYVVWQDARFSNDGDFSSLSLLIDEIAFSRSTDGGFTWSPPIKINKTPTNIPLGNRQAFLPAIRVAADGTIGVTYYDFRNNTADPTTLPTDYFLVHCHPSATVSCTASADWADESRLTAASFDMRKAPFARGFFLGDYEGLAVVGNDFRPVFVQSGASAGTSNAFSTAVGPP
jgi:hypothetical protein